MEFRFTKRNRRGQFEAGPSFVSRNDYAPQPNFGRYYPPKNNSTKNWYERDGRSNANNLQLSRSNSVSSESSSIRLNESGKLKTYTCPKCNQPYSYNISNNTLTGKVPKILPCKHTVCEECITKGIKTTNHVQCATCSKNEFHKKQSYEFNHYVLGQITCSKFNKTLASFPNIALTSSQSRSQISLASDKLLLNPKEKCGFRSCSNPGDISCLDCCGLYCKDCDDAMHKSGKHLLNHKRVPAKKASLELYQCPDHSMDEELFCSTCNENCCCYCVLDKHEGHSRSFLTRLNEAEEAQLMESYEKAKRTRNQLMVSRTKISKMDPGTNEISDLAVEIGRRFADIHAQLHFIEKKLREEADKLGNNSNLPQLNETISSDISTLDKLIKCVEGRKDSKFNLRLLLKKLTEMKDIPTVLVSSEISEAPRLVIDEKMNELEDYFSLDIPSEVSYKLIEVDELPLEYQEVKVKEEKKIEPSQSQSSLNTEASYNSKPRPKQESKDDRFRQQAVFITHINSLDSFFVQFKEDDNKFMQLEQEIKNHVTHLKPGVDEVVMKELYMARRLSRQSKWSRVRVIEKFKVGEEERYKIKFIDYGNTAVVSKDDLMYISSSLTKKKPFAFECKLDNPSQYKWPKDTHLELAKMLDVNRELIMYIKDCSNNVSTVELNISTSTGLCSVTDLLIFGRNVLKDDSKDSQLLKESLTSNRIYDNSDVFSVGTSYEIFIRQAIDPWNMYVQKKSYESSFNSLIVEMENYYQGTNCDIHIPIKNSFVVIYHETNVFGKWHRAKILGVNKNYKVVDVFLVDLGQYLTVQWRNIRKLTEMVKKSECLVVCARLADVAPLNSHTWEKGVSFFLERYSKRNITMKMLVSNNDPLEIVLFQPESNHDLNINALLVENKLASSTGRFTDTKKWLHKDQDNEKEDTNCLFFKDDMDDEEESDHVEGRIQQVELIHFDDPYSFYVSFAIKKTDNEKLHEELQIHYRSTKHNHVERKWEENEKVVVLNKKDNMYYRGIIRAVDGDKYCVDLLDKPTNLWICSDKLRVILPYFAKNFPNAVFKCHMANIKPAGDSTKWSHLSLEWFQMLFKKYNDLFLQKIGDDESRLSIPVTIWYSKLIQGSALEPFYRKYISIDKKVVGAGLAFWVNNMSPHRILPKVEIPITEEEKDKDDSNSDEVKEETVSEPEIPAKTKVEMETSTITEWLPALNLKSKDFYAYITCAENKGFLFIREEKMQKCYKEMEKNMDEYFKTIPHQNFKMRANQLVTVHSDGLYYRSIILKVVDKITASILMVDFGSDHLVSIDNIYSQIMYPDIPIMVSRIQLYDVKSKTALWTDSEVDTLIDTAPEYARIVIRGSSYDSIPLADVYDFYGVCLNDKLVELCPNLYRSKQSVPITPVVGDEVQDQEQEVEEISDEEEFDDIDDDIQTVEDEEIAKEKTQSESTESTIVSGENKRYIYAKFSDSMKDVIDVYDYKTISFYHPDSDSKVEDFECLTDAIRQNVDGLEPLGDDIEIGLPCLSLFEEDKEWYRAKIIRIDAMLCGYVTVIYVDYGNFEVVQLSSLKKIKSDWMDFPARFVDAVIDYKLLRTDQENVLSKHVKALSGETKYIRVVSEDPLLVHVYNQKDDDLVFYYDVFVKNSIVEI